MVFSTIVFLFISNQIAIATGHITDWILGKQPKNESMDLPSTSQEAKYLPLEDIDMSTNSEDILSVKTETSETPVSSKLDSLLANIQFRCAVIMGLIWMMNLLYPSSHPSQGHLLPTH